jgi:hypothetical protein
LNKQLIVLIPYFGQWPFWMGFFLESCRTNPSITWRLFTDCGIPEDRPDNVQIESMSFDDYKQKVSKALHINFNPQSPYKLCDIKPALGLIHQEEIKAFDFWAFGDLDLVYGDLKVYLTEERLKFDLISSHRKRVSGHLCLIRNTESMNTIFKKIKHWQAKFENQEHLAFDEKDFSRLFIRRKHWPRWARLIRYFYKPLLRKAYFQEAYTTNKGTQSTIPWVDGSFDFPKAWVWNNGTISSLNSPMEIPYLHFMYWKRFWTAASIDDISPHADQWLISQQGFSKTGSL